MVRTLTKTVKSCEMCRHSSPVPPEQPGEYPNEAICRRFPPTPVFNPQASSTDTYTPAKWPIVKLNWLCGEFKS